MGVRSSVHRPPQDLPHLKYAQRLLHVLLLREQFDAHPFEGSDDRGGWEPLLPLVIERPQPLGQFLLCLLGLNKRKSGNARRVKASQGGARRVESRPYAFC